MPSRTPEILIVGGGPAGSAAAIHLARLLPSYRDRVLVIDKKVFPREKPCGGGLSGRALAALDRMGVRTTVPSVSTDTVQYRFGDRLSCYHVPGACRVIRRAEFDTMLLGEARSRGISVSEDEALVSLERSERGLTAVTSRRVLTVRAVIGADGATSLVRRLVGLPRPRRFARLHLLEVAVPETIPEFANGAFTFDYTQVPAGLQGYVWDFPSRIEGKPYLNTGVYHRNAHHDEPSRESLLRLLENHVREMGYDPRAARLRSYPDIEYEPGVPLGSPGAVLAGSSAGINGLTGEGIWQSFVYGEIAAESIARAYGSGDWSFSDYTDRIARSPMGRDLRLSRMIADLFYGRRFWHLYSFQERNEDLRLAYIKSFAGQYNIEKIPKLSLIRRWWWHLVYGSRQLPRPAWATEKMGTGPIFQPGAG